MPSPSIAPRVRRLLAAVVLPLSGCYRYVPAEPTVPSAVATGTNVRVYLTPQGMTDLEARLGPRTAAVIGRVGEASNGALTLQVSETRKADGGAAVRWIGERVTIPAAAVARVERRALDRRRSALASVGAALALVAGFVILASLGGGGDGDDGGGTTTPPTP